MRRLFQLLLVLLVSTSACGTRRPSQIVPPSPTQWIGGKLLRIQRLASDEVIERADSAATSRSSAGTVFGGVVGSSGAQSQTIKRTRPGYFYIYVVEAGDNVYRLASESEIAVEVGTVIPFATIPSCKIFDRTKTPRVCWLESVEAKDLVPTSAQATAPTVAPAPAPSGPQPPPFIPPPKSTEWSSGRLARIEVRDGQGRISKASGEASSAALANAVDTVVKAADLQKGIYTYFVEAGDKWFVLAARELLPLTLFQFFPFATDPDCKVFDSRKTVRACGVLLVTDKSSPR